MMMLMFNTPLGRFSRQLFLGISLMLLLESGWAATHLLPIRIGLPHKTLSLDYFLIDDLRSYLEARLNHPVQAVVHGRFNNTTAELYRSKLDFAWVTDYPDSQFKDHVRLLAVPLYKGRPYSTSYVIVSARDVHTTSLAQLKGAIFAFSDRQPNGSYLDLRYQLLAAGESPERFFKKTFFTRSHKDVIKSVALGLAHAGAVDSVVWDTMVKSQSHLTAQTRVIGVTEEYGAAPIIANQLVSNEDFDNLRQVLLGMSKEPAGVALLKRMNVDAFIAGDEKIYHRQVLMRHALGEE